MDITYADKNSAAPEGTPERTWRDVDANEVKDAVNSKADNTSNLSGLSNLPVGNGFVKKTGAGTFTTDQNVATLVAGKVPEAQLPAPLFKGKYISLAALEAAWPVGEDGNYATVDPGIGTDAINYIWDVSDAAWIPGGGTGASAFVDLAGSPYDNAALNAALTGLDTDKEDVANKNANGGYSGLDGSGNVTKVWTTVLTGLSLVTGGVIAAADTILAAFGKLQKQITDAVNSIAAKASQAEVNAGTNLSKYIAPDTLLEALKKSRDVTASWALDVGDRAGAILVDSATATTGTFGVAATFAKGDWVLVTNKGVGNANLVGSGGITLTGYTSVKTGKSVLVLFTSATTALCQGPSVVDWTDIDPVSKPTTIPGYGITDGVQVLWTSVAVVGNTGATRTELSSFPMLAGTLSANGHSAEVRFAGNYAGNANNKRLEVEFDGTVILDTGALAVATAASWVVIVDITRVSAITQICDIRFVSKVATLNATVEVVATGKTLANPLNVKIFGTATADNDVSCSKGKAYKSGI
jgi:hypothetical protein